jgi:uncharacterized protein YodC (DUF2158 family)
MCEKQDRNGIAEGDVVFYKSGGGPSMVAFEFDKGDKSWLCKYWDAKKGEQISLWLYAIVLAKKPTPVLVYDPTLYPHGGYREQ